MSAEEILKLIEAVDPNDAVILDKIDRWVLEHVYGPTKYLSDLHFTQWTRSRDALKEIRPKEWWFTISGGATFRPSCGAYLPYDVAGTEHGIHLPHSYAKTEELAELHAIIQALAHERAALEAS